MANAAEDFRIEKFEESKHGRLIEELTEMLHSAYHPLAEKGMRYLATHQPPETTLSRLKKGDSFLGFIGDELVSTVTIVKEDPHEPCSWYQRPDVYFFTQFAVKPCYQGVGLGKRLMDFVEDYAYKSGAKEMALDTSEHAHHLIAMYEKRGYRFIEYAQWGATNYRSVILSKKLLGAEVRSDRQEELLNRPLTI